MELEQAQKLINQDRTDRVQRVIDGLKTLLEENNCEVVAEMELMLLGNKIVIDSRMVEPDKIKLNIIPK